MRVAVTGGSGFLGQHVVQHLAAGGHEVKVLDVVAPTGGFGLDGVTYEYDDLEDKNTLRQAFQNHDVVMHLAAVSNTRRAYEDPEKTMIVNSLGTQNVFEAAGLAGVDRVVVAGSTLVSGAIEPDPEGAPEIITEKGRLNLSRVKHPYVMSKVHAEMIANVFGDQYGIPSTVFRYGIQYGRNMAPGVVAHAFITNALAGKPLTINGDGEQWRQYTHVADIAAAHALLLEDSLSSETEGTFHICAAEKVSIKHMAELVAELTKAEIEFGPARDDDIEVRLCSNEKANKVLGWTPRISLEAGFRDTIDWYRANER